MPDQSGGVARRRPPTGAVAVVLDAGCFDDDTKGVPVKHTMARSRARAAASMLAGLMVVTTVVTAAPARADHEPWLDPCMQMFHDPQRPWDLDVNARVKSFVETGMKTDAYVIPTASQLKVLKDAFIAARTGKLDDAWRATNCQALKKLHYAVRIHRDIRNGRLVTVMWEFQKTRGWGLYMFGHPWNSSNLAVEVPHACPPGGCSHGDLATALVGAEAFSADNARYLLVNGTPRQVGTSAPPGSCDDSNNPPRCPADAAHNEWDPMIFHELHKLAIGDPWVATAYQPHGFGTSLYRCGPTHVELCDTVVASGTGAATARTTKVTAALRSAGFTVCHFGVDANCLYGATQNAQQNDIETNRPGKSFVSVEVRTAINTGQSKDRFLLARTVAKALTE